LLTALSASMGYRTTNGPGRVAMGGAATVKEMHEMRIIRA